MTERLQFHFSLSCIGEGNGDPLQCSCLENPRDGGAWWAAVYGVAQSQTRLKRLSSSSYISHVLPILQDFFFFELLVVLVVARKLFVAACGVLPSCGAWAPEHTGSLVVARRLGCPKVYGILVPRPEMEPVSPAFQGRFLTTGPPGKPLEFSLNVCALMTFTHQST